MEVDIYLRYNIARVVVAELIDSAGRGRNIIKVPLGIARSVFSDSNLGCTPPVQPAGVEVEVLLGVSRLPFGTRLPAAKTPAPKAKNANNVIHKKMTTTGITASLGILECIKVYGYVINFVCMVLLHHPTTQAICYHYSPPVNPVTSNVWIV
jgi:hypothetical protein